MSALHITKIAFGCAHVGELRVWLEAHAPLGEARITTRNRPTRADELVGGSLYWILGGAFCGRSPLLGFEQTEGGRWAVRLAPVLVPVVPLARRAHQGWRYLTAADAPADMDAGGTQDDALPPALATELARLRLI
jgi:hypothetical protein